MIEAKSSLYRICSPLSEGSPYLRMQVVISGNHDMPRSPSDPCYLGLFKGNPALKIVTAGYEVVDFLEEIEAGFADPRLQDVRIHAIPHDDLRTLDWDTVHPIEGKQNILMTHGVAEGSSLFLQARGREYPIPTDVMARDWHYVALGHWHKQGPVFLSGRAGHDRASRIWYAGSPENMNFADARDAVSKGYLLVELPDVQEQMPKIERVSLPTREMVQLPIVEADELNTAQLSDELVRVVRAAGDITGKVLRQKVVGVKADLWPLVDKSAAHTAAKAALVYEVVPVFSGIDASETSDSSLVPTVEDDGVDYQALLAEEAEKSLPVGERDGTVTRALELLTGHLDQVPEDESDDGKEDEVA